MSAEQRARVTTLVSQRDALEAQRAALLARLTAPGQPGLRGRLVDSDGFPRADVDVHAIRTDRHALSVLDTDAKEVAATLEALLLCIHAEAKAAAASASAPPRAPTPPKRLRDAPRPDEPLLVDPVPAAPPPRSPFALVDSVALGSPASEAGLAVGDWVVSLGGCAQLGGLQAVVHDGSELVVEVLRDGRALSLRLTPRPWAGRGLLGCHLAPRA